MKVELNKNTTQEDLEPISLAEASRITGYHQDYLGQLCRLGKLSGKKLGRNWTTTKAALDEFVAATKPVAEIAGGSIPIPVKVQVENSQPVEKQELQVVDEILPQQLPSAESRAE